MKNSPNVHQPSGDDQKGMNPLVAGAVGATVGVVAASLANPDTRKKMGEVAGKVMEDLRAKSDELQKTASEKMDQLKAQTDQGKEQLEGKAREARQAAEHMADKAETTMKGKAGQA